MTLVLPHLQVFPADPGFLDPRPASTFVYFVFNSLTILLCFVLFYFIYRILYFREREGVGES